MRRTEPNPDRHERGDIYPLTVCRTCGGAWAQSIVRGCPVCTLVGMVNDALDASASDASKDEDDTIF